MAKLNHDPVNVVIDVVNKLYPNNPVNIIYLDSRVPQFKGKFFRIVKNKNGKPTLDKKGNPILERFTWGFFRPEKNHIYIDFNASIPGVVDLIAHEFAHAVTFGQSGEKDSHGPLFQDVYGVILESYRQNAAFRIED